MFKKFNFCIVVLLVLIFGMSCSCYADLNPIGDLILVEGGTFQMEDKGSKKVNDFYIGKYEITHEKYIRFMNEINISSEGSYNGHELVDIKGDYTYDNFCAVSYKDNKFYFKKSDVIKNSKAPMVMVSWWGAIEYCNWLSKKEDLKPAYDDEGNLLDKNGNITNNITKVEGYRLPTEKEWEYAAHGGKNGKETTYAGSDNFGKVGWYDDNSEGICHPVGKKKSNELGIYDMSGNVWEWCQDWYYDKSYEMRVLRGGSWNDFAVSCTERHRCFPSKGNPNMGFRIVRTKFNN